MDNMSSGSVFIDTEKGLLSAIAGIVIVVISILFMYGFKIPFFSAPPKDSSFMKFNMNSIDARPVGSIRACNARFGESIISHLSETEASDEEIKQIIVPLKHNPGNVQSRFWRREAVTNAKNAGENNIKIVAGEFGQGLRDTAAFALAKGMNVTLISGPFNLKNKSAQHAIKTLSRKYPNKFKYLDLPNRPLEHFTIFGNRHIFIEKPHDPDETHKESWGILNSDPDIMFIYEEAFLNNMQNAAKYSDKFKFNFARDN